MPSGPIEQAAMPTSARHLARRPLLATLAALATSGLRLAPAWAEDPKFFRIGTGAVNGTYYPVGELIASVISTPPGAPRCDQAGGCGVADLIAIVQTSKGSVENVAGIEEGRIESGFVQSDVAFGAFTGSGIFAGREPMQTLRALASLYLESVHLVARSGAGIKTVADLRGKRVSLDVEGSGTLVEARQILDAFGLSPARIEPVYAPLGRSIDLMVAGELDALFLVAGYPATAVSEITRAAGAALVPIEGPEVEALLEKHRFFTPDIIPAGVYPGHAEPTTTIAVAALWLVAAGIEDQLVYEITAALWQPAAREILTRGHPKGEAIRLEHALRGVAIPVHPGAARFYREHGIAE